MSQLPPHTPARYADHQQLCVLMHASSMQVNRNAINLDDEQDLLLSLIPENILMPPILKSSPSTDGQEQDCGLWW